MAAVLLSLTLLVLVVQTGQSAPQHKKQKRKYDREWKTKRGECLRGECNNLHLDENDNCLNLCASFEVTNYNDVLLYCNLNFEVEA